MSPAPKDGCLGTVCVLCSAHGFLGSPDGGGTIAGGRAPVGNMGLGVAGNWGGNWFEELPPGVLGASPVVLGTPALSLACAAAAVAVLESFANLTMPDLPMGMPSLWQAHLS